MVYTRLFTAIRVAISKSVLCPLIAIRRMLETFEKVEEAMKV